MTQLLRTNTHCCVILGTIKAGFDWVLVQDCTIRVCSCDFKHQCPHGNLQLPGAPGPLLCCTLLARSWEDKQSPNFMSNHLCIPIFLYWRGKTYLKVRRKECVYMCGGSSQHVWRPEADVGSLIDCFYLTHGDRVSQAVWPDSLLLGSCLHL